MPDTAVTEAERAAYQKDGAVVLRDRFAPGWLETLREGIDAHVAAGAPNFARHTRDPGAPAYLEGYWAWQAIPQFEDFVRRSPCGALAASLLGAPSVNLVMDNWFLREAGSTSKAPFHQDLSYFDFAGTMCVLWLPLEGVTAENGIAFVKGSHRDGRHYMRARFADDAAAPAAQEVNGIAYHVPPDPEAEGMELLAWDLAQGDCIFFDMRTLHGARAATTPTETVRRFTLRMTAPDGVIRYRGDWARDERAQFEAAGYGEGDRIEGPMFPRLWP